MNSYLLGYCYWSGEDIEDEDSEAAIRLRIYTFFKNKENNPWRISWYHTLSKEW